MTNHDVSVTSRDGKTKVTLNGKKYEFRIGGDVISDRSGVTVNGIKVIANGELTDAGKEFLA